MNRKLVVAAFAALTLAASAAPAAAWTQGRASYGFGVGSGDYGYGYGPGYYNYGYVAPGYAAAGRDMAYCEQHYRSYDPASGTYLGYDGVRHSCP